MTKIIKLKEGDEIPKGAKFLHSKEEKTYLGSREVLEDRGFFFDSYRTVHRYWTDVYFFYEVDEPSPTQAIERQKEDNHGKEKR